MDAALEITHVKNALQLSGFSRSYNFWKEITPSLDRSFDDHLDLLTVLDELISIGVIDRLKNESAGSTRLAKHIQAISKLHEELESKIAGVEVGDAEIDDHYRSSWVFNTRTWLGDYRGLDEDSFLYRIDFELQQIIDELTATPSKEA